MKCPMIRAGILLVRFGTFPTISTAISDNSARATADELPGFAYHVISGPDGSHRRLLRTDSVFPFIASYRPSRSTLPTYYHQQTALPVENAADDETMDQVFDFFIHHNLISNNNDVKKLIEKKNCSENSTGKG